MVYHLLLLQAPTPPQLSFIVTSHLMPYYGVLPQRKYYSKDLWAWKYGYRFNFLICVTNVRVLSKCYKVVLICEIRSLNSPFCLYSVVESLAPDVSCSCPGLIAVTTVSVFSAIVVVIASTFIIRRSQKIRGQSSSKYNISSSPYWSR